MFRHEHSDPEDCGAGESLSRQVYSDKLADKQKDFSEVSPADLNQSPGSTYSVIDENMISDCESTDGELHIAEDEDVDIEGDEIDSDSEVPRKPLVIAQDKQPESVTVAYRRDNSKVETLHKVPGSSRARLESLVNNLMQNKTQKTSRDSTPHSSSGSPTSKRGSVNEDRKNTDHRSVLENTSEATKPFLRVPLITGMPLLGIAPINTSRHMYPPFPFMTPFGIPPMMPLPQLPTVPSAAAAPPAAHQKNPPSQGATNVKLSPSFSPPAQTPSDAPLDLSLSARKRKLDLDNETDVRPLNLSRPEPVKPQASTQGLLQIHIPQSIRPPLPVRSPRVIPSPTPSVLPRHGSSAFTSVSSPIPVSMSARSIVKQGVSTPQSNKASLSSPEAMPPPRTAEQFTPPIFANDRSPPFCLPPAGATSIPVQMCIKEMSVYEHNVLQTEFIDAAKKQKGGQVIRRLQQTYRQEINRLEMEHHQSIRSASGDDLHNSTIHTVFDNQRLLLAKLFKAQLDQEKTHLDMVDNKPVSVVPPSFPGFPTMPFPAFNMGIGMHGSPQSMPFPMMPGVMPHMVPDMSGMKLPTQLFPGSKMLPENSTPNGNVMYCQSLNSSLESNSAGEQNVSLKADNTPPGQKRRFLSQPSVQMLKEWYENHFNHPYPEENEVNALAIQSSLKPSQVTKWMANKRVRSFNTLAYNKSIHPKKLEKLRRLKKAALAALLSQSQNPESPLSKTPNSNKKCSKRLLDPSAVDFMTKWYANHVNYPYPTEAEKAVIAQEAGISLSQVTCWFANKRNRCNHPRKTSSKVTLQKLNRRMQIYESMVKKHEKEQVPPSMVPKPKLELGQQEPGPVSVESSVGHV